jgi:hypothetical protein|tara:strand:- start:323 stop:481 length:159 start_codon:yes stop_codon:yes gene_type:complete
MRKSNYIAYKSALLLGKEGSLLVNKLSNDEIKKAKEEVETELRNKNFKIKSF